MDNYIQSHTITISKTKLPITIVLAWQVKAKISFSQTVGQWIAIIYPFKDQDEEFLAWLNLSEIFSVGAQQFCGGSARKQQVSDASWLGRMSCWASILPPSLLRKKYRLWLDWIQDAKNSKRLRRSWYLRIWQYELQVKHKPNPKQKIWKDSLDSDRFTARRTRNLFGNKSPALPTLFSLLSLPLHCPHRS